MTAMDTWTHRTEILLARYGYVWEDYARQQPLGGDGSYRRQHRPLTTDVMAAHLQGRLSIATYLLREDQTCIVGILDHDGARFYPEIDPATGKQRRVEEDGVRMLDDARYRLYQQGIDSLLFVSGRRGGAQLHVYAAEPVTAREMRALLGIGLGPDERERMRHGERAVEILPDKSRHAEGTGPSIRVPFGEHLKYEDPANPGHGKRCPALDYRLQPVAPTLDGQLAALARVERVDVRRVLDERPHLLHEMDAIRPEAWRQYVREQERERSQEHVRAPERSQEHVRAPERAQAPAHAVRRTYHAGWTPRAERVERGERAEGPIQRWVRQVDTREIAALLGADLDRYGHGHCPVKAHHKDGDRTPSFHAYPDGGWTCFAAGVSGRNAYDLVAWSLGFDHKHMSREEHRATMEACQALRYVPEATTPTQSRTPKIPA